MHKERLKGHVYTDRIIEKAAETRVRYQQECHLKSLYVMLHEWFIEERWVEGDKARNDADWPEPYYFLKETQRGKEHWIWWRFAKAPAIGEGASDTNNYYRYVLDIFWHIMGVKDIEVMKQGQKFKTNFINLEIVLQSYLELDWMHEIGQGWRDKPFLKGINEVFHKRIFKKELDKQKHNLYRETYRLQEVIKTFLGMKSYMPEPAGQQFWPQKGVGDQEGLTDK
jgi:hypothetical protein